jgi:hypothetical protein
VIVALISWFLTGPADSPVAWDVAVAHAYLESRYQDDTVTLGRGSMFCGSHQAKASSAADCRALRDPLLSARRFRAELTEWVRFTGGDMDRAWRGMGCGVKASRVGGHCRNYERRIRAVAHRIRLHWINREADRLARKAGS